MPTCRRYNKTFQELGITDLVSKLPEGHAHCVPATEFARTYVGKPVPNAALIGGFAAVSGKLSFESVENAIRSKFGSNIADGNVAAAKAAYSAIGQTKAA